MSRIEQTRASRRTARRAKRGPERFVDAAFVVVLIALAAIPLWPIYQTGSIVVLIAAAIVLGSAIAFLGARLRWPGYVVAIATAVGYLLVAVPLADPSETTGGGLLPSLRGWRSVIEAVATGWKQMLTARIPFGSYETLAVPALVTVLAATVIGVSIALRSRRPGAALVAPLAVLTFGIAFGSDKPWWPVRTGIALAVVVLVWAALRSGRPTFEGQTSAGFTRLPRLMAALVIVAVCAGGGWALARPATATDRHVLREQVVPPVNTSQLVSPLIGYRNEMLPPGSDEELFTVSGLPTGTRIRLATLDVYNGLVYAAGIGDDSGSYERIPLKVENAAKGRQVTVRITITGYSGTWVPTVGCLESIAFSPTTKADSFYYNQYAAAAVRLSGLAKPTGYTMTTRISSPLTDAQLASVRPGPAQQPDATGVPQELIDAGAKHVTKDASPGKRLVELADWLRSGYVSHGGADEPASLPGHSADRLRKLVTSKIMLGDAEQYATAYALLARQVGFPARVVVGYAPKAGQTAVHGSDTTAWVEVQIADGTWVSVDPNPEPRPVPQENDPVPQYVAKPRTVLPPPPPQDDTAATSQSSDSKAPKAPDDSDGGWLAVVLRVAKVAGGIGGVIALITSPLWVLGLIRLIRRRRRKRSDRKRDVVTGAWSEMRDALIDRGYEAPRTATRMELATVAGTASVLQLAERADRSVFDTGALSQADVDAYWADVATARRDIDSRVRRRDRWRRRLSLRSLRRAAGGPASSDRLRRRLSDRRPPAGED